MGGSDDRDGRWWPWPLLVGGVLLVAGGVLHPQMDPSLSDPPVMAAWIADPAWTPSHALIMASALLFLAGLLGLARSGALVPRARTAAWVAVATALLFAIESVPHLLAPLDHDAVLAGEATPFLSGHLFGAVVVYPLFGIAVAVLALFTARQLTHPVVAILGAGGAVAWGVAPIGVGPLGIDAAGALFQGALLMGAWFAVAGATELVARSRQQPRAPQPA